MLFVGFFKIFLHVLFHIQIFFAHVLLDGAKFFSVIANGDCCFFHGLALLSSFFAYMLMVMPWLWVSSSSGAVFSKGASEVGVAAACSR